MKIKVLHLLIFYIISLVFTGCELSPYVDFTTNIKDGTVLNENNTTIIFSTDDPKAKLLLNFKQRKVTVNEIDVTSSTRLIRQIERIDNPPYKKVFWQIVYTPTDQSILPEGDVNVTLTVPYRNKILHKHIFLKLFGQTEVSKTLHIFVDTRPPVIQSLSPEDNATIHNRYRPLIFTIFDNGSGVDTNKTLVKINNTTFDGNISFTDTNLTIFPDTFHPLPEGNFTVTIFAQDKANNSIESTFHFKGQYDNIPPSIAMLDPLPGSIITDPLHPLTFQIIDDENGSGVDLNTTLLHIVDTNTTYKLTPDESNTSLFRFTPQESEPLPYGNIELKLYASDRAGNDANQTFTLFLREKRALSAQPIATPQTAYAPATIRFSPKVSTDTAIQTYYWDFDGDGIWDRQTIFPETYTWQYNTPGTYKVLLKIVDANGKEANGSTQVQILNAPPQVSVDLSPSNGNIPLKVSFIVQAQDHEGIASYKWDFNDDGTWDYSSTETGNTSYTYTQPGLYNAKLRVTDTFGAYTDFIAPTTTVYVQEKDAPTVTAYATPTDAEAPATIEFDAQATDPLNKGFTSFEWDFDGDGVYDYNGTSPKTNFTFTKAGHFYPRIKVTTVDGRTSFDATEVYVKQSIRLSLSTDTIEPELGETVEIRTHIGADTEIMIQVEDSLHNPIYTVVPWQTRQAGDYTDIWNGKSQSGETLQEGPYYVVLFYKQDSQIRKIDLRETSGGIRFNPPRTNAPRNFYPYDNKPLRITFTLNRAAEVVSFVGYSYSNTRIITFRNRQPLGRGSYTDIWYSQNDDGALVTPPPGSYFLYGVWAYTLADNAIYVKSGVHLQDVTVNPPVLSPSSHEEGGEFKKLHITFTLNKEADIEITVFDAQTGVIVAGREYKDLPAGENTITFDGKDNNNTWLHPGTYTLGVRAIDKQGYRSLTRYAIMRIVY